MRTINYTGIYSFDIYANITAINIEESIKHTFDVLMILQMVIASVGIIGNFTVVFAFMNHKQLRSRK